MGIVTDNIIYAGSVVEFVRIAGDFCRLLETCSEKKREDFILSIQRLLPELYLRLLQLPDTESVLDEDMEKFVSEDDWNEIHDNVRRKLSGYDSYDEVFDPVRQETEDPVSASLSENFADIFQDLKNFLLNYGRGDNDIMNDAIWECKQNFEAFWGQKLVNALRAVHNILYSGHPIEDENDENETVPENPDFENLDTSSWILSKMQGQYKKNDDE